ncbi:MAG: hypothetical protein ACRDYB_13960, partial [Acidimicrobiales bacterium]
TLPYGVPTFLDPVLSCTMSCRAPEPRPPSRLTVAPMVAHLAIRGGIFHARRGHPPSPAVHHRRSITGSPSPAVIPSF